MKMISFSGASITTSPEKCSCGQHRLRGADAKARAPIGNCDMLDYVTAHNDRLRVFRQRREEPLRDG